MSRPGSSRLRLVNERIPNIGERCMGRDIGRNCNCTNYFIGHACKGCGKIRWVMERNGLPQSLYCDSCCRRGEKSKNWRGGRINDKNGYIQLLMYSDNFFFPMAIRVSKTKTSGYILEHRLVMAKHLGRCLHRWEIVHHKNGIKGDNKIANLQLVSDDRHNQITILETRIGLLESRVTILEAENTLLRSELGAKCDRF